MASSFCGGLSAPACLGGAKPGLGPQAISSEPIERLDLIRLVACLGCDGHVHSTSRGMSTLATLTDDQVLDVFRQLGIVRAADLEERGIQRARLYRMTQAGVK